MATDEADKRLAAPGELELVRAFVNTRDLGKGTDRIDAPEGLSSWLAGQVLVLPDRPRGRRYVQRRCACGVLGCSGRGRRAGRLAPHQRGAGPGDQSAALGR